MYKSKPNSQKGSEVGANRAHHDARAGTALRVAAPHDMIQKVNFFNRLMGAAQRPTR